jgi:hypothetical protein
MHEYHKRWTAYVNFAIKMDELLLPLSETMNRLYDILFPGFPILPSFSIFRFCLKIWKRSVFQIF